MPIAMPATGALIGTPASISDSVEAQTLAIEVEPFELEDVRDEPERVGELLLRRAPPARAPARRARRGRSRDGAANRCGPPRPSRTAGSCSGGCTACVSSGSSVSIIWVIRSMPERGHVQDLRVAPVEQRRAVRPRDQRRPRPRAAGCPWGRGRRGGRPRSITRARMTFFCRSFHAGEISADALGERLLAPGLRAGAPSGSSLIASSPASRSALSGTIALSRRSLRTSRRPSQVSVAVQRAGLERPGR